jgi:hypothetical protein
MTEMPSRRGPVRRYSHARASPPSHGARRGQQVRHTRIRHHSACPLNTMEACKPRDGLSWLLVMSRRAYTSLLTSGPRVAMPGVVEVWRGPNMGACTLAPRSGVIARIGQGVARTRVVGRGGTPVRGVGRRPRDRVSQKPSWLGRIGPQLRSQSFWTG